MCLESSVNNMPCDNYGSATSFTTIRTYTIPIRVEYAFRKAAVVWMRRQRWGVFRNVLLGNILSHYSLKPQKGCNTFERRKWAKINQLCAVYHRSCMFPVIALINVNFGWDDILGTVVRSIINDTAKEFFKSAPVQLEKLVFGRVVWSGPTSLN